LEKGPEGAEIDIVDGTTIVKETYMVDINHTVAFKPEYSWNYEIGFHSEMIEKRLSGDVSLFYININNQQIAEFSPQGTGRMIKNAGKSRSYGAEASLRSMITKRLGCNVFYGFTMATFTDYKVHIDSINIDDSSGNRVPFSPQHTLSVSADYKWIVNKKLLDGIYFNVQCVGNGNIYWTEENEINQPFYALLNANISFRKKQFQLDVWGKNLSNTNYLAFYFETLGNPFAQKGNPVQFGATFSLKF
jgi:outer membrane receptor protein involved in Fe transport